MTIITIRNTDIAADKIAAMTRTEEVLILDVGGAEPLDWSDPNGELYAAAMKQWRDYLETKEARILEAVQYGVIMAAERGSLCTR